MTKKIFSVKDICKESRKVQKGELAHTIYWKRRCPYCNKRLSACCVKETNQEGILSADYCWNCSKVFVWSYSFKEKYGEYILEAKECFRNLTEIEKKHLMKTAPPIDYPEQTNEEILKEIQEEVEKAKKEKEDSYGR